MVLIRYFYTPSQILYPPNTSHHLKTKPMRHISLVVVNGGQKGEPGVAHCINKASGVAEITLSCKHLRMWMCMMGSLVTGYVCVGGLCIYICRYADVYPACVGLQTYMCVSADVMFVYRLICCVHTRVFV